MASRLSRLPRRRQAWLAGTAAVAILAGGGAAAAAASGVPINPFGTNEVGMQANGRILLPDNQWISPYGQRTQFEDVATAGDDIAPVVGSGISPDGADVAVQTDTDINIVDASTGAVLQSFAARGTAPPVYSPDGTALYAGSTTAASGGNGTNTVYKYTVGSDGLVTDPSSPQTLTLPGDEDFPFALALSPDGSTLYAALSASNALGVIDTATMQLVTKIPVGNAPAALAIAGNQVFVANRGGRTAVPGDTTNLSHGTPIVSSPVTGAAVTGTVTVVDTATNTVTDNIKVGLSPASLTLHDGSVFVTNSNSDTVSIIDANTHQVTQTFNVEPLPGSTVGASPNSVAFSSPNQMLVSVGRDNAIAVFGYNGPTTPVQYQGLIPTDYYPDQVNYDAAVGKVIVSNQMGIGSTGGDSSIRILGTLTSFTPPSYLELGTLTTRVFENNGWNHLPASNAPGNKNQSGPLPAIPARLGEPSAIKHVFLIIKENRTYDQVLGDIGKGNSDPADANIGAQPTPNLHSLANTFTLFDNFYSPATVSADGHNWWLQADNNDYLQQDLARFYARSYPYPGGDALAYQRDGFIWNDVEAAGKTVRNYGEFESITTGNQGSWQQYYADSQILEGQAAGPLPVAESSASWSSDVPSLNAIEDPAYPHFDPNIPDQYRADVWLQSFDQQLKTNTVPNLTIMTLGDDHTGGPPTADAQYADNDLATGRIIQAISHSKVWKSSAVFVVEDDTQSGVDHVDGHRAPLWIASPYAKRGVINSSYYTDINAIKTIEQILGAQPMNQMDRAAVPMFDAFTNKPNFTPYNAVPETIPLTQGVSNLIPLSPPAGSADSPAQIAKLAATSGPPAPAVPAAERAVAAQWAAWEKTIGPILATHGPDSVSPAMLNRYDWYSTTGWSRPYPGDSKILAPDQVPGRNLPTDMSGD